MSPCTCSRSGRIGGIEYFRLNFRHAGQILDKIQGIQVGIGAYNFFDVLAAGQVGNGGAALNSAAA